jgi:dephospho-CoA kinase
MKTVKIAITGGIGSGKSTVSEIIKSKGFLVLSCDEIYRQLLMDERFVFSICEITKTEPIMCDKGYLSINRELVSAKVFADSELKLKLEAFTHPAIMDCAFSKMEANGGVTFCEVPLLFECNMQSAFDEVIVVLRNKESRISSVISRDGLSREQALSRIKNQFNYENFVSNEHTVICNDSSFEDLVVNTCAVLDGIIEKYN